MISRRRSPAAKVPDAPLALEPSRERRNVSHEQTLTGYEWRCEAGQNELPIGCERHRDHHWCETCLGFYGVPHDGIHDGDNAHPEANWWGRGHCACRPCKRATGRE